MLEFIKQIIYEVAGKDKDKITYDTDLITDLELTSYDIMNIICMFEDQFDVSIPSRDVWNLRQVKDVLDYIRAMGITDNDVLREPDK